MKTLIDQKRIGIVFTDGATLVQNCLFLYSVSCRVSFSPYIILLKCNTLPKVYTLFFFFFRGIFLKLSESAPSLSC